MAIVSMKMGNLSLVQSLITRLIRSEGEKQGLLKEMKQEQERYEEYKKLKTYDKLEKNKRWR